MEDLDDRTYDLLFAVRRSVRYHERRRRFFEIWNSITVGAAAVGGSSAVATILSTPNWEWLPVAFAGAVSALGAIDLVVSTARRAGQHGDLSRQFIALEQKFAHGRNLKDREHEESVRERLRIEASEPTILRLLDLMPLRGPRLTGRQVRTPQNSLASPQARTLAQPDRLRSNLEAHPGGLSIATKALADGLMTAAGGDRIMRVIRNIAAADQAAAAAMRPRLEELKRKTGRAAEAAFRECRRGTRTGAAGRARPGATDDRGADRRGLALRRGASSLARRRMWLDSRPAAAESRPIQPTVDSCRAADRRTLPG